MTRLCLQNFLPIRLFFFCMFIYLLPILLQTVNCGLLAILIEHEKKKKV